MNSEGIADATNPLGAQGLHHVALIVSQYERSKAFYTQVLGCSIVAEEYRAARDSWKLDLAVPGGGHLELFSFPEPPPRVSRPEACGLRHLAISVQSVPAARSYLQAQAVECEEIRWDEATGKPFFFFSDPDGLPLEIYAV
ncbi:VOC family protein [Comamonas sp. J-3]|uniref:SMU1112c/YaeR family gloxylase I-like metalloprotein n=1 Tax=Comamonas trifloxystrobinivorans TaxID=3350256 RepID=UPI00372922D0